MGILADCISLGFTYLTSELLMQVTLALTDDFMSLTMKSPCLALRATSDK